ncbi:ERF family protein [Staphylococcus epidermidis]|nr:ERF family protein [Staphylococcus epidermidis]MCG1549432.1 ERF family protein [Staphylococcus epidermidis]MCG1690370.1 ERF family protein [Staphylococcus epidermidis]MCG1708448.1 ERF family protein [Staphylococcus epidermidis]MCG2504684.1 ERF family protein [Staphylococcus epidermidis]
MPEKLNIYQKIAEVKASIEGFQKDAKGYNYDYVEGSQILYKMRPKMEEHGLLMFPSVEEFQHVETKNNKGKTEHIVILKIIYNFVDSVTKDKIEINFAAFGQQQDVAQAYGTALTYAERYFILKLLNIPTDEDDPDAKQKKQKYSKADKNDIDVLKNSIETFAQRVGDTVEGVKQQLGIISYKKLSVFDCMQALQTVLNWNKQISGGNQ